MNNYDGDTNFEATLDLLEKDMIEQFNTFVSIEDSKFNYVVNDNFINTILTIENTIPDKPYSKFGKSVN